MRSTKLGPVIKSDSEFLRNTRRALVLQDVRTAMKQVEAGEVLSNREAKAELRRRFGG